MIEPIPEHMPSLGPAERMALPLRVTDGDDNTLLVSDSLGTFARISPGIDQHTELRELIRAQRLDVHEDGYGARALVWPGGQEERSQRIAQRVAEHQAWLRQQGFSKTPKEAKERAKSDPKRMAAVLEALGLGEG